MASKAASSILFTPIRVGTTTIPNRFVRSATNEYLAEEDGRASGRLAELYRILAQGEVGLIITGHMNVRPEGKAGPRQTGIFEDRFVSGLSTLTASIRGFPTKIFAQLAHAGRQTKPKLIGQDPVSPSAVYEPTLKLTPREAGVHDIQRIRDAFVQAARRADEAGFDGVQLHCAHGYLLSAFLSPHTNRRTDEWGGSTPKRARLVLDILRAIKALRPGYPVIAKLNSDDFLANGLHLAESVEIARMMEDAGLDGLEVSGGTAEAGLGSMWPGLRAEEEEGYFVPAAAAYKAVLKIPVFGLGGNRTFAVMDGFVRDGRADLISLSRPFIREPALVKKFRLGEIAKSACISCNKCLNPRGISCAELRKGPPEKGPGV